MLKAFQKISSIFFSVLIMSSALVLMPTAKAGPTETYEVAGSMSIIGRSRMQIPANSDLISTSATINVSISGLGLKTIAEVNAKDQEVYQKIKNKLDSMGLDFEIDSSYLSTYPTYDYEGIEITDYYLSHDYNVTIKGNHKNTELMQTINALSENGVTINANGLYISYVYDQTLIEEALGEKQLNTLRDKAFANGLKKAQKLAKLANLKLGKVTYISESMYISDYNNKQNVILELSLSYDLIK